MSASGYEQSWPHHVEKEQFPLVWNHSGGIIVPVDMALRPLSEIPALQLESYFLFDHEGRRDYVTDVTRTEKGERPLRYLMAAPLPWKRTGDDPYSRQSPRFEGTASRQLRVLERTDMVPMTYEEAIHFLCQTHEESRQVMVGLKLIVARSHPGGRMDHGFCIRTSTSGRVCVDPFSLRSRDDEGVVVLVRFRTVLLLEVGES